jgi:hypothetical protein
VRTRAGAGIVAVVITAAFALAACGESGSGIDRDASEILQAQVKSARAAVAAGDPARAGQLLQAVDDTVASLRADHLISDRKAADVLSALGATQDALHSWVASSTTTSTTSTTVPPPPPQQDDHGGKDRDKGGKGKGGGD